MSLYCVPLSLGHMSWTHVLDTPEALLSRRVPYLQFDRLVANAHYLGPKLDANGVGRPLLELVLEERMEDARLARASVPNDEELEQEVCLLFFLFSVVLLFFFFQFTEERGSSSCQEGKCVFGVRWHNGDEHRLVNRPQLVSLHFDHPPISEPPSPSPSPSPSQTHSRCPVPFTIGLDGTRVGHIWLMQYTKMAKFRIRFGWSRAAAIAKCCSGSC